MIVSRGKKRDRNKKESVFFCCVLTCFFCACFLGGIWGNAGSGSFFALGLQFTGLRFVFIYSVIWFMSLLVFFYFPATRQTRHTFFLIIVLAAAARGLVFFQVPSDDVFRYLWEGGLINKGVNPYQFPPAHHSLTGYAACFPFYDLINHPEISAAYPPLVLLIFSLIAKVSVSVNLLKTVMTAFDLGSICFLILILQKRKINLRWSLLYALNPLILYSFAGEGHFDAVQNFFLLGALVFYDNKKWGLLFLFAGAAVQIKYVAVIALPFFVCKENYKFLPIAFLIILIPFIPFFDANYKALFTGIRTFEGTFAFNGSVHALFRTIFQDISHATMVCRLLFSGLILWGIIRFRAGNRISEMVDPVQGILFAFGCLIILSPTIHIWYLSWILPFAIIRNTSSWIVLSLFAGGYYVTKSVVWYGGGWSLPVWVQIVEWLPFYLFLGFELFYAVKRKPSHEEETPKSVSVIIPVLNEATNIQACIRSIQKDRCVTEIIVVDGGSDDDTFAMAEKAGALAISHKKSIDNGGGRGGQILKGIQNASGDIIAIVHSDTLIQREVFSEIQDVLKANPDCAGGAVGTVFDNLSFTTGVIELLNRLRAVFLGISFGDQIQFFRRQPVVDNHLFPEIPLMEDIEFSLQLPKAGRRVFLFGDAVVSSRRWQQQGASNFVRVLRLFSIYLIQRIYKKPDVVKMYQEYYNASV